MKIEYGALLLKAWKFVQKRKRLWFFGAFLATDSLWNIAMREKQIDHSSIVIGIVMFAGFFLALLIKIMAQTSLIKAIAHDAHYKNETIRLIIRSGIQPLGKLFLLDLLCFIGVISVVVVLFAPVAVLVSQGNGILGGILAIASTLICLLIVSLILFSRRYAYYYVILSNETITTGFRRGYALFIRHIGHSLAAALLVLCVFLAVQVLLFIALIIIGIPFFLIGVVMYAIIPQVVLMVTGSILALSAIIAILVAMGAAHVFLEAFWYYFFQIIASTKLSKKQLSEPVVREVVHPEAA